MSSHDPEQPERDQSVDTSDPLDRLLAAARWPEPTRESQRRVEAHWRSVSPANGTRAWPIRLRRPLVTATAAAVILAAGLAVALWVTYRADRHQIASPAAPMTGPEPQTSRKHRGPLPEPQRPYDNVTPALPPIASRPPTPLERLAVKADAMARRSRREQARQLPQIDDAVDRLAAEPAVDPSGALAAVPTSVRRDLLVGRLAYLARTANGERQLAAVRMLGTLQLPSTLPLLTEFARDDATKAAALPFVARRADPRTLAALAWREPDESSRRVLLAALLERGGAGSAVTYLRFVADRRTSASALAALDDVPDPPVDALIDQLGNADVAVQRAAAKALGRVEDPAVTRRLAAMLERGVHRRPAAAALLYSDRPDAARAIAEARRYRKLAATIESVEAETGHTF